MANQESDIVGLVMHNIIHILTVLPAVTPISLIIEDVDPFGIFLKKVIFVEYELLSENIKLILLIARLILLSIAMLEISQTFRTIFNFGLSVFHIYRKCLEVPLLSYWHAEKTIKLYKEFQIIHAGFVGFMTPLGAFFLGYIHKLKLKNI